MKNPWTSLVAGAAALLCVGAAQAFVIDFENVDLSGAPFAPLLSDGDALLQGSYAVQAVDLNNDSGAFNGSLVGQLSNGSDPTTCLDQICPSGNATSFVSALNNGGLFITGPGTLALSSFSAAFLPPSGVALPTGTVAFLGIEADRADGTYAIGIFSLGGPNASTGTTAFTTYRAADARIIGGTGTLTSGSIVDLLAFAYYCGTSTSCSVASTDRGQFAIDDIAINVPAVPEPAGWTLMALGLGALGVAGRRRRRRAA